MHTKYKHIKDANCTVCSHCSARQLSQPAVIAQILHPYLYWLVINQGGPTAIYDKNQFEKKLSILLGKEVTIEKK